MPEIETNPRPTETRTHCPLCDVPLDPNNPDECPKCDWVRGYRQREAGGGTFRDRAAVMLSIVPGLGHIYKGHRLLGALLMLGSVFAACAALLAGFASAGWGALLLPLYWAGVMLHVYWLEDLAAPRKS
jgi:hypothetical protein